MFEVYKTPYDGVLFARLCKQKNICPKIELCHFLDIKIIWLLAKNYQKLTKLCSQEKGFTKRRTDSQHWGDKNGSPKFRSINKQHTLNKSIKHYATIFI